jgi:hypothetical protein
MLVLYIALSGEDSGFPTTLLSACGATLTDLA